MKAFISVACLLLVAVAIEARPKRSVLYAAAPVVASVPVVKTAAVVHDHPTTVVRTEQINDAHHGSSYSYSTEVKSNPHVHHHQTVAAAPVVAAAVAPVAAVSTVHHTVPATYSAYYPSYYAYSHPHYYSPYSAYGYVVGK